MLGSGSYCARRCPVRITPQLLPAGLCKFFRVLFSVKTNGKILCDDETWTKEEQDAIIYRMILLRSDGEVDSYQGPAE
jgi:hypothetical protein